MTEWERDERIAELGREYDAIAAEQNAAYWATGFKDGSPEADKQYIAGIAARLDAVRDELTALGYEWGAKP